MAARISDAQWATIRKHWEFDIDEPSLEQAASRAGKEHKFTPPAKSNVYKKQIKDGWARKGNMTGLNQAAQMRADKLVDANGDAAKRNETKPKPGSKGNVVSLFDSAAQDAVDREESLKVRTEVNARHRQEWRQIVMLRQEAMKHRDPTQPQTYDLAKYYGLLKAAKLAAEITAIQQAGERKAWGMDVLVDPNSLKGMSDEALEAIASGKQAA